MSDRASQTWSEYKPSKTVWAWSCVGAAVLTMVVGFTWGGWVTGGTARAMVSDSTETAVAELAAGICVHRFLQAPEASASLAALKEADSWKRDSIVEDAGWVTFADMKEPVDGAAEICADRLATMELPVAADTSGEIREVDIVDN